MKVLTRLVAVFLLLPFCQLSAAEKAVTRGQRQAEELVREALQREVYGLEGDRQQLLAAAVTAAPDHAAARWQQGYVRSAGAWKRADSEPGAARQVLLENYQRERANRPDRVADQLALANWCGQQGLKEQEAAHLLRVCQLEPDHAEARARLGFIRQGLEWVTGQELAEKQARDAAQQAATEKWTATLNELLLQMNTGRPAVRRQAREQIARIRDPLALPALQAMLASRGEEMELFVVEITAQMTGPEAAAALARTAVTSDSRRVRSLATEKLPQFDEEAYVPQLVAAMYTPVSSQFRTAVLRDGRIGYHHEFTREGLTRLERLVVDADYRRAAISANAGQAKAVAMGSAFQTAQQWERGVADQNKETKAANERIVEVLRAVTGANLSTQPQAWWSWWAERNEVFIAGAKPTATIQHFVSFNVADRDLARITSSKRESLNIPVQPRYDCFAAGTPVWTESGPVAIEQVRIGDLVLSRDVETGELAFKPVVRTTVRPAGRLIRTQLGDESFETSNGHEFWVSGEGWRKARRLEAGMVLHSAAGPVRITNVGAGGFAQTYNLVVADFSTYFVGRQKVLSHDNTVSRRTKAIVPGLQGE